MKEGVTMQRRRVKICVLGGEKVGKTTLAMKLVGMEPQALQVPRGPIVRELAERNQNLEYHLLPPINSEVGEIITQGMFDMFVCMFKDSTSFGQLYEFLEGISSRSEEQGGEWRDYWLGVKNMVLVYYEYSEQGQVQIEELFNILSEEIRNFNRSGTIKQFVLKKDMANHQYLRELIEKTKFDDHVEEERRLEKTESNGQRKEAAVIEAAREAESKDEEEDEDMPKIMEIKLTSTKQKESLNSEEERDSDLKENIQFSKENKVADIEVTQEIKANPVKAQEASQAIIIQSHKQPSNEIVQINLQKKDAVLHPASQPNPQPNTNEDSPILVQEKSSHEKEAEHYQQVYRRLMEKINNEEIEASKKTSYKNIFEEFRKTSKQESKISKELLEYWQQKIEKLEEDNEIDEEQQEQPPKQIDEEEEEKEPVIKQHVRSADNPPPKHGQPLKPHSNYVGTDKPKKEKAAVDSKLCLCEVM